MSPNLKVSCNRGYRLYRADALRDPRLAQLVEILRAGRGALALHLHGSAATGEPMSRRFARLRGSMLFFGMVRVWQGAGRHFWVFQKSVECDRCEEVFPCPFS
jgi:hypothetical protein